MTGAEIENVLTVVKYELYEQWVNEDRPPRVPAMTVSRLVSVLKREREQATFRAGTARDDYNRAEADAKLRGWPFVG